MHLDIRVSDDPALLNPPRPIRALAFDPGFAIMGIAVVDFPQGAVFGAQLVHRETVKTSNDTSNEQRLDALTERIQWAFQTYHPDLVAWENVAGVSAGKEARGAAKSSAGARIREVCGIMRMGARVYGERPHYVLAPATYRKMVFGQGQSKGKTKTNVRTIIERFMGVKGITFDESEAIAMALCGYSKWKSVQR